MLETQPIMVYSGKYKGNEGLRKSTLFYIYLFVAITFVHIKLEEEKEREQTIIINHVSNDNAL